MSSPLLVQTSDHDQPRPSRRRSRRRLGIALGAILVLLAVVGGVGALVLENLLDPGEAIAGVTEVTLGDNEFSPAAIEVPTSTTVTWRWDDVEAHNVVGDDFESPVQTEGEFAHAFAEPGTHSYRCTLHYLMRGEVVVTE